MTEAESFAKLWAKFSARTVKTWDNQELYYYKSNVVWADYAITVPELLASKNGQCNSWNQLLEEAIKINGLTNSQSIEVTTMNHLHFLVKNWSLANSQFGFFGFTSTNGTMVPVPTNALYTANLTYLGGGAQNNVWPAEARFAYHQILLRDGVYYDPSYGRTYTGTDDFQSQSVFGIQIHGPYNQFRLSNANWHAMQFTVSTNQSYTIPSP